MPLDTNPIQSALVSTVTWSERQLPLLPKSNNTKRKTTNIEDDYARMILDQKAQVKIHLTEVISPAVSSVRRVTSLSNSTLSLPTSDLLDLPDGLSLPNTATASPDVLSYYRQIRQRQHQKKVGTVLTNEQLHVVHVDDHLVVVNKPPGVLCVPGLQQHDSILTPIYEQFARPSPANITGVQPEEVGQLAVDPASMVVHRLDMDTSGLVVFGRYPAITRALHAMFRDRQVEKEYEAILQGHWPVVRDNETVFGIDLPLQRDHDHPPFMRVATGESSQQAAVLLEQLQAHGWKKLGRKRAKPCQTLLRVVERGSSKVTVPAKTTMEDDEEQALLPAAFPRRPILATDPPLPPPPISRSGHTRVYFPGDDSEDGDGTGDEDDEDDDDNQDDDEDNGDDLIDEIAAQAEPDERHDDSDYDSISSRFQKVATPTETSSTYLKWTRVRLTPLTGRTHQLRVHCAALGFPIVGDPTYGLYGEASPVGGLADCAVQFGKTMNRPLGSGSNFTPPCLREQELWLQHHPPNVLPMCLHATLLAFRHPVTGEPLQWHVPPEF
jgi:23S rRNA-/tRNA-specific pseudouridylate synthase